MTLSFSALRAATRWSAPPRSAAALALLLAGCASPGSRTVHDPLEPVNRAVYSFNEKADRYVAKPVARTYEKVLPQPVRTGIKNFFNNIDDVMVVVNDLLQLKFKNASRDGVRLMANTLFGGLGLVDVAGMRGITKRDEDFGQTLGYWGVPAGPFVMLPLLGPSNLRDAPAIFIEGSTIDPVWHYRNVPLRNAAVGLRFVDQRAQLLSTERVFEQAAVDRYAFLRDAYAQRRINLIYDGDPPRSREMDEELEDPGEGSADDPAPPPK